MAYGDVKSPKPSSGGYGRISYGRSETQAERDAHARASSREILDYIKGQSDPCAYMLAQDGSTLLGIYRTTRQITTHGKFDWERILNLLSPSCRDKVRQALDKAKEAEPLEQQARAEQRKAEYEHQEMLWAQEAAKRKQEEYDRKMQIVNNAQLVLGSLQSETSEVFRRHERYELDNGDYLEDPVSSRLRSGGWVEDTTKRGGFRLQLTISLDVSNSNWHNRVAEHAIKAFQELVLAARALHEDNPESVAYSAWLFSMNRDGKGVRRLKSTDRKYDGSQIVDVETDDPLKEVRELFDLRYQPSYAGEDSWLSPLLEKIAIWEAQSVGEGYVKLDIILSDGVFERKVDISRADDIQAGRGQAQTVIMNFMNEDNWHSGRLPYQCVQYPVNSENVSGLLRLVLANFLEAYI